MDNAAYRAAVDGVFTKLYGPAGATLFSPNGSKLVYTTPVTEGATGVVLTPGVAQLFYQYDRFSQLDVATPAGGGVVGRTKISEDNNPLPRDRVFFNTDYFSNTRLLAGGLDVTRFAPGFEATFFDQLASFEVQFPFAATLSAGSSADGFTGRDTVFGNIFAALKGLAYSGDGLSLSGGLGLAIPTSPDAVVKSADGGDFVRIKNESWNVVTFVAAIYAAPGSRFFWQNWASVTYDTTGSPVVANFDGTGQRRIGSIRDQSVLALDTQVGYWLIPYGSGTGVIQALSPFVELHYNTAIGDNTTVRAGSLALVPTNNRYDEVNLTTGMAAYLANNLLVSSSVVVPLSSGSNKFFEYQVGLRVSWFFGATAANPVPAQLAP